jgi:hypothetical protein
MTSRPAFNIRITHEACGSFMAIIRTGEIPARLAAQVIPAPVPKAPFHKENRRNNQYSLSCKSQCIKKI